LSGPRGKKKGQETMVFSKDVKILTPKYSQVVKATGSVLRSDFASLIECPPDLSVPDWIIINAVCFLERVELLFSTCSLFCTPNTCPMFNAGPHYAYYWEDEDTSRPVQLSAPEYFVALKRWMRRHMSNASLFPMYDDATPEAIELLKTVYRRLFRVLAHLYMCHFSDVRKQGVETAMNTVLEHYRQLVVRYELMEMSELEMLEPVFAAVQGRLATQLESEQ
jgi:MOB kinase activator 1